MGNFKRRTKVVIRLRNFFDKKNKDPIISSQYAIKVFIKAVSDFSKMKIY